MAEIELRNSIIESFNQTIKDDSKLIIFDSMTKVESPSLISESHYKIVKNVETSI